MEARVSVSTAGTRIDRVVAMVSPVEVPRPTRILLARGAERAEGVLCFAPGTRSVVEIRAYDRGGRITHTKQAVLDVSSVVPDLVLELAARDGGLPLALRVSPRERSAALTRAAEAAR